MAHGAEKHGKTRIWAASSSSRSLTAWKSSALAPPAIGGIGGIGGLETVVMAWLELMFFKAWLCRTM